MSPLRYIKARIEQTNLGEISQYIAEVYDVVTCYIVIKLDMALIEELSLEQEVNVQTVRQVLMKEPKLKLKKDKLVAHDGKDTLRVWPPDDSRGKLSFEMQRLRNALSKVVICGMKAVVRAVVIKKVKPDSGIRGTWNLKVPRCACLSTTFPLPFHCLSTAFPLTSAVAPR